MSPDEIARGRAIAARLTVLADDYEKWLRDVGEENYGVGGSTLKDAVEDVAMDVERLAPDE